MIETVFAKTRLMERVVGDPRGGWRLPVVRRLILATVLFLLASLAVAASASAATSFTNTSPITIPNPGNASPYPSEINVRGLTGPITDISVTLHRFGHKFPSEVDIVLVSPDDLDLLLVGPQGQKVILMSDACGSFGVNSFGWVWDDEAPAPMPDGGGTNVCSARFQRPTDYEPGDSWPTPAPPGPYSTSLSAFDRTSPNGTWQLFVNDDSTGNTGFFTNRFTLGITADTTPPTVVSVSPANDARGIRRITNVSATFSEAMRPGFINRNTFELFKAGTTNRIGATVSYDGMGGRALLNPNSNLRSGTRYKAVVTTGAKDLSGNGLDQNPNVAGSQQKVWSFTTKN